MKQQSKAIKWKLVVVECLYKRDNGFCQLCKEKVISDDLWEVDHIIEREMGGADNLENLRIVHLTCHKKRHQLHRTALPENKNMPAPLRIATAEIEKKLIINALQKAGGNQTKAASILNSTKRIVQYKIKKYNINTKLYV